MLLENGQFDVSTIPIIEGWQFYRCTRVKDDTKFVASITSLAVYKALKTVGIERLQAVPHDNLLKAVRSFTFNDHRAIFFDGKGEKIVLIYEDYKGKPALLTL